MADSTYELLARVTADASQAVAAAKAVGELAAAERDAAQAADAMAKTQAAAATAMGRLEQMAARGNTSEQAALKYRDQMQEITRLKEESGNFVLAQRAAAQAQKEFLDAIQPPKGKTLQPIIDETVRMGDVSQRSSGSIVNLVRQLNDVGVMATMGASPLQIMATQGEQIAFALSEAGIVSASFFLKMMAGLPWVAAAVAAAATAWVVYKNATTDAASETEAATNRMIEAGIEASKLANTLSEAASKGWKSFEESAKATSDKLLIMTGETTQAVVDAEKTKKKLREDSTIAILELGSKVVSMERLLSEATTGSTESRMKALSAMKEEGVTVEGLRDKIAATTSEMKKRVAAQREAVDNADALAAATDANAAADKRAAEAAKAEADARRAASEAARRAAEERRKLNAELEAGARAFTSATQFLEEQAASGNALKEEALRYERLVKAIEAAAQVGGDQQMVLEALDAAGKQHVEKLQEITDAQNELTTATVSATAAQSAQNSTQLAGATRGVNAAGGGANGLLSALGNAGPYGGLIAGILSLIENLDKTVEGISDFVLSFAEQLGKLPETVGSFVDDILTELLPGLIDAIGSLLEGLPDLIKGLLGSVAEMIPNLLGSIMDLLLTSIPELIVGLIAGIFDADMWKNAGKSLVQGFTDNFKVAKGKEGEAVGNVLTGGLFGAVSGLFKGSYASGIDRTTEGFHYLHRDEQVINRARTARAEVTAGRSAAGGVGSGSMFGSGGEVYIRIDAGSMAQTMQGLSGRGYSFGGGS